MVYTEHAPKKKQFYMAPAVSTPLLWIFKTVLCKVTVIHQLHYILLHIAVFRIRDQRYTKMINQHMNCQHTNHAERNKLRWSQDGAENDSLGWENGSPQTELATTCLPISAVIFCCCFPPQTSK